MRNGYGNTILVVDDEERIRSIIGEHLDECGFKTVLACNGDDALLLVKRCPEIDLIITDVKMPGILNGFDFIESALASRPTLRTIIMSGFTDEAETRRHVAQRFLIKPFTMSYLENEVYGLLEIDS
ncbi:response regulator [Sphingomonas sp. H160509]|uniref:response regulator n=1 Tax=Sphingomonas sp. H160509 TaxID=2955313 RepID=UPI0020973D52|nr:response regulator [Sphingomonas sp. H160509]MDD1453113.1 response regulator [Sphingomonas sp. H160509]